MQTSTSISGRLGRAARISMKSAVTAALALTTAGAVGIAPTAHAGPAHAGPAHAGPGHGGYGDDDGVRIQLTERTAKELRDGRNFIRGVGAADLDTWRGKVSVTFPVRDVRSRGGEDRDGDRDDRRVIRLRGGIAYTGAGPDVVWRGLRINLDRDVVTARINGGDRVAILRFDDRDDDRDDDRRDRGGDDGLRLTRAGAASLNRAAQGSPFRAGNLFAGDSGDRHHDGR